MFRSRVTIQRYSTSQDDAGQIAPVLSLTYSKFADVQDKTGSVGFDRSQRDWEYNYRIKVRYEPTRQEQNGDLVIYNGKTLAIKEISTLNEGKRRFNILRCTTVE